MCMIDDAERMEFCRQQERTARKAHRCQECNRTIQLGERYEAMAGKCDGELWTQATCTHCLAAREWLVKHCDGWVWGAVGEELSEHFTDEGYRVDRLGRLVVGMRRKWSGFSGGLSPVPK